MQEVLRRKVAVTIRNNVKYRNGSKEIFHRYWEPQEVLSLQTRKCLQILIQYGEYTAQVATLQAQNQKSGLILKLHIEMQIDFK